MSLHKKLNLEVNPYNFFISIVIIILFVFLGAAFPDRTNVVFGYIQEFIVDQFGWLYILSVSIFLIFVIYLFFSRFGKIKLGPDDSEPDYSYASWFTMLFSAGMGIGLVFFSVAEPMFHYLAPPTIGGESLEAAREAMRLTFFHWGFHPWAIYIIVGMSLAYFHFRKGLPLSIRSAFYPLLGDKIYGWRGNTIDILAIFGTMFGVATSLGLGVMQVNAGLEYLFGVEVSTTIQILLIAGITAIATISVVLGLDKGIRRLSNFNMSVAVGLIIFVFILGPTVYLLNATVENTGYYLQNLVQSSFWLGTFDGEAVDGWLAGWTLFYWGWWIAWSPFVGMFIARISRGRSIQEFVGGVLLVPTAFTFIWLTVFGNTALNMEILGDAGISGLDTEQMLFAMLDGLPLATITSIAATLVIITFFVTSSDSGSLVIDMLASGGNPNPPVGQRVFWALSEGAVAAVLLLAGGLGGLQTAAITTGLPFTIILLLMCYSLYKGLSTEGTERLVRRKTFKAKSKKPQDSGDIDSGSQ
ncbi:BCCT family transporter [Natronogracilivirga saccharolytica]|uniref:BCCT family transporter n=1 Tax=Natronogracilivirga saccharolytica TaxID=2812953 RepID=A0A8J7USD8_9BACT|nr:BCCT family transporter [Natronogracilivirga saccharolytica]MBP3191436.1 BCCT family transporter [Natronogracilivirga saccharolytica]